jgi:multidrug efflux pump subunit AcrA (membrane-fusion protein)
MAASSKGRLVWIAILLVAVVTGAFFAGYMPRRWTTEQLIAAASKRRISPPLVNAARVKRAPSTSELTLPGNVTPITEAYVFARAAGYLKKRYVDIGDRVHAGQLLADIDAPDLDQQVSQSQAALAQAQGQLGQAEATLQQLTATHDLAELTWQRYKVLTASGAVSRQDGDNQSTAAKTAEANVQAGGKTVRAAQEYVRASAATLERLKTLQEYERLTAPFAGVITARNVDVGALISATGSSLGPMRSSSAGPSDVPSSGEIFRLAEISRLRVLVSVPQSNSAGITVGGKAKVTVQELPDLTFPGVVTRTSSSLDAASRTLLTEVQVENQHDKLLPGMYASVQFATERSDPPYLVPDAALVVRSDGTWLAFLNALTPQELEQAKADGVDATALGKARRVHFQRVNPGRDYGIELEILDHLQAGQEVAVDPTDAVQEGAIVQLVANSSSSSEAN